LDFAKNHKRKLHTPHELDISFPTGRIIELQT